MPVSQEQYDALLDNLKWVHAIASILVERQEEGTVNITKEVLGSFDLRGELRITDLGDYYEIKTILPDIEGEVADE